MDVSKVNLTRLVTVKQLTQINPAFTVGMLRWLIHKTRSPRMDDTNGFIECIVRRSKRRLLIDLDAFERWLARQREKGLVPIGV